MGVYPMKVRVPDIDDPHPYPGSIWDTARGKEVLLGSPVKTHGQLIRVTENGGTRIVCDSEYSWPVLEYPIGVLRKGYAMCCHEIAID